MRQAFTYDNSTYVLVESLPTFGSYRCEIWVDNSVTQVVEPVEADSFLGAAMSAMKTAAQRVRDKYAAILSKKKATNYLKTLQK